MVEKTGALQGHAPEMVGDAPLMYKCLVRTENLSELRKALAEVPRPTTHCNIGFSVFAKTAVMLEGSYIRRDLLELDNLVLEGDLTPHLVLTRLWLPTCRCLRLLYLVLQPTNIRVIHEHLKGSIPTLHT